MIRNCYHFYGQNIKFKRNHDTFKNKYLFENDKKKMSCTMTTINIYYKKLHNKICSKIHLYEKNIWEKGHVVLF
jgi:hypothetical protein